MSLGGQIASRDNFGRLLEPGLRKIVFDAFKRYPTQYTQVFNVNSSKKAIETDLRMGGFSLWGKKGTLEATTYEDPTGTDTVQYKHETFSKGFIIEKEMVDDELYGQMKKLAKALGEAARQTVETQAATVWNDAFTAQTFNYKGEALVGTHKRLDGGTRTNYIGALTLSESNLEIAHKLASEQVDERGLKIQLNPKTLVVPRALELTAKKILHSQYLPATGETGKTFAENDINPLYKEYEIVVLDYLTNPKAWFLIDKSIFDVNFFWREKLNFKNTTDFDTDAAKYKGRMRFSFGWTSDIGVLGANPA
ncbi:Mu-like prophage major head subunit gpT [compost metagenome]